MDMSWQCAPYIVLGSIKQNRVILNNCNCTKEAYTFRVYCEASLSVRISLEVLDVRKEKNVVVVLMFCVYCPCTKL